ncbi:hypothetical protein H0H81_006424 [Sphagnurus paluster]|uniref:Uncharacterized protein n=1 Tax=Sphagnurus paluster TaxID=117069 RepID=A0A9P7GLM2_9AGAR|nr:hypothetical protein H0H81_006424 [Sphagnurus paluster]
MDPVLCYLKEGQRNVFSDMLELKRFAFSLGDSNEITHRVMWNNEERSELTYDGHKITITAFRAMFENLLATAKNKISTRIFLGETPPALPETFMDNWHATKSGHSLFVEYYQL